MPQIANTRSLDTFDREILEIVQANNQQTHAAIGERIGLSPSSVRRRLKRLRDAGIIEADVSIVRPEGAVSQIIVMVSFETESMASYDAFRARMSESPEVTQIYSVSGNVDFILVVQSPDLSSYEAWGERMLMSDPAIRRYDSHVVWSRVKFSTALPSHRL